MHPLRDARDRAVAVRVSPTIAFSILHYLLCTRVLARTSQRRTGVGRPSRLLEILEHSCRTSSRRRRSPPKGPIGLTLAFRCSNLILIGGRVLLAMAGPQLFQVRVHAIDR